MATRQHKIVIIEADAIDRAAYRRILEHATDAEYVIREEDCAAQALATLERSQPDGILLNAHLPGLDGAEFLHRLENGHSFLPFAVVILTTDSHEVLTWETAQPSALEVLVKNQVTPETLQRTMRYAIEKRDWLRKLEAQQRAIANGTRQLQHTQEALQQARERERLATVGTMAVYLTHHLGNHFNNLSTSVQLLERHLRTPQHDPQLTQLVQELHEEISRSLLLLQDLRLLSDVHTLQFQPVVLADVVNAVVRPLAQTWIKRGINLSLDIPAGVPEARADMEKLGQVVLNLCTNAVEAMPQGGNLTLSARATTTQVILDVQDTGGGIAPNLHVFEPNISTKLGGAGLGLTIARQLMVAQQGTIRYTSALGQGTTFTLTLPVVTQT